MKELSQTQPIRNELDGESRSLPSHVANDVAMAKMQLSDSSDAVDERTVSREAGGI